MKENEVYEEKSGIRFSLTKRYKQSNCWTCLVFEKDGTYSIKDKYEFHIAKCKFLGVMIINIV